MRKKIIYILAFTIFLIGCNSNFNNQVSNDQKKDEEIKKEVQNKFEKDIKDYLEKNDLDKEKPEEEKVKKEIDYEKIKPNEAGKVMIIMYHSLGETESKYSSTPEIFKNNLKRLNSLGYSLVSLEDYVNNEIDIPAGRSPVVITFDDGHKSNFNVYKENDKIKIDSTSAVGILEEFNKKNPEFGKTASFFLNSNPFGQKEYIDYKINFLVNNGYSIGNHTNYHQDLTTLNKIGIINALAKQKNYLENINKNADVNTLALPFGKRPKDDLEKYIYKSNIENKEYKNIAVLNVGWKPEVSPIHKDFNYKDLDRVQAGSLKWQLNDWIDYLEQKPGEKYISDGVKNILSIPKSYKDKINLDKIKDKELKLYERN
ncbi:MAG: polysaccharide deacetylase family protein [Bacillota bacterium]